MFFMEELDIIRDKPIIKITNLIKKFILGDSVLTVINGLDLEIYKGDFVILMGPSGSGKTTLLNLIGGIDTATSGSIVYSLFKSTTKKDRKIQNQQIDITTYSDSKLTAFRRKNLSYVFQFYSLIPTLSAKENVQLMAELVGVKGKKLDEQSSHWLKVVGLENRLNSFPGQLSGGENQRVAIARAIAKKPLVLLCDEPTGQLDQKNGRMVVESLYNVSKTTDTTILMVTHDQTYKTLGDRIFYLEDGKIIKTEIKETN
jgi:putative ABC transport system ATP-binding protein